MSPDVDQSSVLAGRRPRHDLRAPVLGLVAWGAALAVLRLPRGVVAAVLLLGVAGVFTHAVRRGPRAEVAAWLGVAIVVALGTAWRVDSVRASPMAQLAHQSAVGTMTLQVVGDPQRRDGRFGGYVLVRASVRRLVARGAVWPRLRDPVLVIGPTSWGAVRWGQSLRVTAPLAPADGDDLAAVVTPRGPPTVLRDPAPWWRVVDRVRAGVRTASGAGHGPVGDSTSVWTRARVLVPALVDGDDGGLPQQTQADFRATGLTHLLAVSGTNLTLVVGALLLVSRAAGVRARGLIVVGGLGVVGFVLLARPEPSVLRAAAMGSVALLGMGSGGSTLAGRTLGVAVLTLMLVDPWLAEQVGFALSAVATAGIVYLAPGWRDALGRWLPRWAAEAVVVPLAAQLVCTPIIAALSGQVSMIAVVANMVAAPVVGPATVLGLAGGLSSAVWSPLGRPIGEPAVWCGAWLVAIAHRCASLPTAVVGWRVDAVSLVVLTALCAAVAMALSGLLARRGPTLGVCGVAAVALLLPDGLPTPGWPPAGWVMVACDVGQGDGLVLRVDDRSAVVVDTGPDPVLIDSCLRRLHVRRVPLVVLTHFHADHIDGLAGVLRGRSVGLVEVTTLNDPASGPAQVSALLRQQRVPERVVTVGEQVRLGPLHWQVLAPSGPAPADSDSPPNDASIVMLVETRDVRIMMMGDEETGSQARLADRVHGLRVDVLKVAHHGSSKQDPDLVRGLHPRLAVISDGVDNDYGHPAASTLRLLASAGATVRRTDTDGDVAVVVDQAGRLASMTRMPAVRPPPGGAG